MISFWWPQRIMNMSAIIGVFMRFSYFEERQANLYMKSKGIAGEKAIISAICIKKIQYLL